MESQLFDGSDNGVQITGFRSDSLRAIRNLYALYADALYGIVLRKSADEKNAEEIFVKIYANAYRFLTKTTVTHLPFSWFILTARHYYKPVKNHLSRNAVTMEEQVLEMIICNGATPAEAANEFNTTEDEIRQIIKSTLKTYRQ